MPHVCEQSWLTILYYTNLIFFVTMLFLFYYTTDLIFKKNIFNSSNFLKYYKNLIMIF